MSEPLLFTAMRHDPDRHVVVVDPWIDKRFMGTTAKGFLSEYEAHIRQVKAEAWDEATDYVSRHYEDYLPVGWSRRANEDNPYRIESQETP